MSRTPILPDEYRSYVESGGVKEASLDCDPFRMQLWPIEKIEEYNRGYQVQEYAPGFLCFGSNGGGELLAFDESGRVVCLDANGMEPEYAIPVADSWAKFVTFIRPKNATRNPQN
jgi:hypothetical protein